MEFGIEKWAMFIMKRGYRRISGRNRTSTTRRNPNAWKMENHELLGIVEVDTIKQAEMKEKLEYKREKFSKLSSATVISPKE